MYKKTVIGVLIAAASLLPQLVSASSCASTGYTIEYINGVFDTLEQAKTNQQNLKFLLPSEYKNQAIEVKLAYNPEHLAGVGDVAETISQMLFSSISDYDLRAMLRQIAADDTTRKLLLVGHSQGALYANSIYDYTIAHGEPAHSVDVYAVATPAHYVAGGGTYINSAQDAVIEVSRALAQKLDAPAPLPSNVSLPGSLAPADLPATHEFQTYIHGAREQITSDIDSELAGLGSQQTSPASGCFTPPAEALTDSVQAIFFAIADPLADMAKTKVETIYDDAVAVARGVIALVQAASAVGAAADGVLSSPKINPAAPQNQEKNFAITKKLYGSSIDQEEYEELNNQGGAVALALVPDTSHVATSTAPIGAATTVPIATSTPVLPPVLATTTSATSVAIVIMGGTALPSPAPVDMEEPSPFDGTETDIGTTTDTQASTTPPVQLPPDDATTTPPVSPPFLPEHGSVSDTFDAFNSAGWLAFDGGSFGVHKLFDFDDGGDGSCFSGGCIVGNDPGNGYVNITPNMSLQMSPALESGAYTLYARARGGFNNPAPVITVCDASFADCNDQGSVAGISFFGAVPIDEIWHKYYVAWRQGTGFVQSCIMQDDADPANCTWRDTNYPAGAVFNGIDLWSANGWRNDLGGNLWFDELQQQ